jgi:hypothetical protein
VVELIRTSEEPRVTGHLGCELAEVVLVSEKFPSWEQVNVQRGVEQPPGDKKDGGA